MLFFKKLCDCLIKLLFKIDEGFDVIMEEGDISFVEDLQFVLNLEFVLDLEMFEVDQVEDLLVEDVLVDDELVKLDVDLMFVFIEEKVLEKIGILGCLIGCEDIGLC